MHLNIRVIPFHPDVQNKLSFDFNKWNISQTVSFEQYYEIIDKFLQDNLYIALHRTKDNIIEIFVDTKTISSKIKGVK